MYALRAIVAAVLMVIVWCGAARAADPPAADPAAVDKLLYAALKDMHNRAAEVYNKGDANGCYHMFQGGLLMAKPLLAHRPEVQKLLDDGMAEAERLPSIPQRALKLHKTIEAMRDRLKPAAAVRTPPTGTPPGPMPSAPGTTAPTPGSTAPAKPPDTAGGPSLPGTTNPPTGDATKSLWDRLGGETVVVKAVDDFVNFVVVDQKVNLARGGQFKTDEPALKNLKYHLVNFISQASGGTLAYTGRTMVDAHKGMNITAAEFDEMVKWLRTAFEKHKADTTAIDDLLKKVQETKADIVGK